MGSSKKHKEKDREREHRHKEKRRHRSRSRSPSSSKHRKHKRDRDDHDERKRPRYSDEREPETAGIKREISPDAFPSSSGAAGGSGEGLELTIEETNKLRAKLGLKPLDVPGARGDEAEEGLEEGEIKPLKQEDVHVPAVNIRHQKKTEALKDKMQHLKEKRRINQLLGKVKTLGDESDDEFDSASSWVIKNRKVSKEKEMAAKRAKLLEEMDQEFGIGGLVEEEFGMKKPKYSAKDLKGLNVQHAQDSFKEGQTVILTLKDKGVLDEEEEETLLNVNMIDDEKASENVDNKKKRPDYKPYDEPEFDEYGMAKPKEILDKYDEEIGGKRYQKFQLGAGGKYDAEHERRMEEMKTAIRQQGQTLTLPAPSLAREFYTEDEFASFKKVKKKVRKIRKKPKVVSADDLVPLGAVPKQDHGSRHPRSRGSVKTDIPEELIEKTGPIPGLDLVDEDDMDVDKPHPFDQTEILGPEEDLTGVPVEEDTAGVELQLALNKARKLKKKKDNAPEKVVASKVLAQPKVEVENEEEEENPQAGLNIVLNSTSEFCRALGEIPTYGMAGNREEDEDELMEFEQELVEQRRRQEEEDGDPQLGWQSVQIDTKPVEIEEEEKAVLDDEPVVNAGLAVALKLAEKKGYLEAEVKKQKSAPKRSYIDNDNYSIEDKRYDDLDEKYRKRERYIGGAIMDFKEKDGYKPQVKLEYVDDSGRFMSPKEAFRYLSHRFHGKGSGLKKTEKRSKKLEEEYLMKSMSSTDTPLGTVNLLQEKQKEQKTPYIVLSGGGKALASASGSSSLSKHS